MNVIIGINFACSLRIEEARDDDCLIIVSTYQSSSNEIDYNHFHHVHYLHRRYQSGL